MNIKSEDLRIGIVGTGFISNEMARSITRASGVSLKSISGRNLQKAKAMARNHESVNVAAGIKAQINQRDLDALYVGVSTTAKEQIALAAIQMGKHVIVDKPFYSASSAQRIASAATSSGVVFLDGTHFTHHPRTKTIIKNMNQLVGRPKSLHTCFYFPIDDQDSSRLQPAKEPMGAIGDMAWYSIRAAIEFLRPRGNISNTNVSFEKAGETIVSASGLMDFETGERVTFDVGYTAGTAVMDLSLLGTTGMISMDDFVLDWKNSFVFSNPQLLTGFTHRSGYSTPITFQFVETPSPKSQDTLMFERFGKMVREFSAIEATNFASLAVNTQKQVDAIWKQVTA